MVWPFPKEKIKITPIPRKTTLSNPKPKTYFGKPPGTPFDAPGTYILPGGDKMSSAGGSGGGSSSSKVAQQRAEAQQQAQVQAQIKAEQQRQAQVQAQQRVEAQKIQQQVQRQRLIEQVAVRKGTIQRSTYTTPTIKVHSPGTIYRVQTGNIKIPDKNKYIPETKTYTVGKDWSSKDATAEERKQLRDYEKAQSYKETALQPTPSRIKMELSEVYGKIKDVSSEEIPIAIKASEYLSKKGKVGEFVGGAVYGTIGTKGGLIRTGVITGATAGVGLVIGLGTKGATAGTTALFGARAGQVVGTGIKVGTYGAGAYYTGTFALGTAQQIYESPTAFEKGRITGRAGADIGAGLYGFRVGSKGADVLEGLYRTRGGTDITKIATDPLVESGKHKFVEIDKDLFSKLTQKQRQKLYQQKFEGSNELQKALGVGKGGIHVTDIKGDYSELTRALHIAPKASTRFSGVKGEEGSYNLFKSFKDILTPKNK